MAKVFLLAGAAGDEYPGFPPSLWCAEFQAPTGEFPPLIRRGKKRKFMFI